jgi:hypothetical protein
MTQSQSRIVAAACSERVRSLFGLVVIGPARNAKSVFGLVVQEPYLPPFFFAIKSSLRLRQDIYKLTLRRLYADETLRQSAIGRLTLRRRQRRIHQVCEPRRLVAELDAYVNLSAFTSL